METLIFPNRIVLIADTIKTFKNVDLATDDLEFTEEPYFNSILNGLKRVCREVIHYDDPGLFINNIAKHKIDIVFSLWSGRKSRNRRALIPSICEAYKIKYIGADAYTNIICQDKAMSKEFCKKFQLYSPGHVLVNQAITVQEIAHLKMPLVVKPNFEGGSIGIAETNLKNDRHQACELANELLDIYKQEILIEEFVFGREISFVLSGSKDKIKICEAVEIVYDNDQGGLKDRLYSYEIKKENEVNIYNRIITSEIPVEIIEQARQIFQMLGKVENLRIDGRYDDNKFSMIELSPDIFFGEDGTFACAFMQTGYTFETMLTTIIQNCL
ncbi:D-alanine-D-alanine ligase [Mucilaginibacter oryzae]|uniref:D-alanine-D-alanine ligase n=1 Tax=Mucilaginibacter oryzae TaxID=468058 RepID=A0A316HCE3_9SPHI|nr:hypothetical protein [Mucilaginibacter oryzae]PWK68317.1 D-alanine-D-alanine ligase [Mucilaginibacter oryzae]